MWSTIGEVLGAVGLSAGGDYISGAINNYYGQKARRDQYQLSLDQYKQQAEIDYQYAQLYNKLNYELAQNYAVNTPSWAVQGLRKAGLNPILAASGGFNANLGQSGVSSSGSGSSSFSSNPTGKMNISEAARDLASLDVSNASAKQLESQTSLNRTNEGLTTANSARTIADIDRVKAETDAIKIKSAADGIDALERAAKGGEKGAFGILETFSKDKGQRRSLGDLQNAFVDKLKNTLSSSQSPVSSAKVLKDASSVTNRDLTSHPIINSAKSVLEKIGSGVLKSAKGDGRAPLMTPKRAPWADRREALRNRRRGRIW